MHICVLTPADAKAFQALRLRGLQECPDAFASSFDEEVGLPSEEIENRLVPKADSAVFGAFRDSVVSGLVGLQRESMAKLTHKSFVWGMHVAPEVRGLGIGGEIMSHALKYAAQVLGSRQVNLGVNTQKTPAVSLYKRRGFVHYGHEHGYLLVGGVIQWSLCRVSTGCAIANGGGGLPFDPQRLHALGSGLH